jgi:hypothetical protein
MNYTIPLADQFHQAFLFTIDHKCNGQIIPKQILLSKNLNELDTMSFDNLRKMAKKLNIPGRHSMNKNTLSNCIRGNIMFE